MSRFAGVPNRRCGGSSPDPRIGSSRVVRPKLAKTLQTKVCKNTVRRKLGKIKEIIEISNVENIAQTSTSESEAESVCALGKDRPSSPVHVAKKVQMKSQSTTSLMNSETSSGFTMPSNVSSVSLVSPFYASNFEDSSDAQSYFSSPEKVRGFDPLDESAADLPDQTRWKKKNSTLLEISKAMPISELTGLTDFSMISHIINDSSFYLSKSPQTQQQYSEKHLVSTFVSGKPLCKIKKNGKTAVTKERSSFLRKPMSAIENLLTYTPHKMEKAKKIVTFGSPLATVIPRTELTDEDDFCNQMDTETIPNKAELSLLFKKLYEKNTGMFIHHPVIRLLSKSGGNVCEEPQKPCTPRMQCCCPSSHRKCHVLNKRTKK